MAAEYADDLPQVDPHAWRRIRGEQEIIARFEPEQAVQALPRLLAARADRQRLLALLDKVTSDERVQAEEPPPAQVAMLARIRAELSAPRVRLAAARAPSDDVPAAEPAPAPAPIRRAARPRKTPAAKGGPAAKASARGRRTKAAA